MNKAAMKKIIDFFDNNEELFNKAIEELDSYNGYLGDDRYYTMDMLAEFYQGVDPIELLQRAYFGRDNESWHTDSNGNKIYDSFNPNREYFYYNGYGNLVSSNYIDYSDKLDEYAIEEMSNNRQWIDTISDNEDLNALFDELEIDPEDSIFFEFCENQPHCDFCIYSDCKTMNECKERYKQDNFKEV